MEKEHIHLVCIGHLDHGKSSILGRLFYDSGNIADTVMERIKKSAKELGKEGFEFAFIMDQIKEERARGITIGLAHNKLITDKISFTFADAPGHRDFVKNMLAGASESDGAILVVAADCGIKSQTEQHLYLSKMLGVPSIIVAVNKMDLVKFSEDKFQQRKKEIEKLIKKVGYNPKDIPIVPCSALKGDNVVGKTKKMKWYSGHPLMHFLENLPEREEPKKMPLRMPVQDIYEIDKKPVVIGRVDTGELKFGDEIVVMPRKKKFKVEKIYIHDKKIQKAEPGDNICLYIKDLYRKDIKRGDIIGKADSIPVITDKFTAQIIVLNHPVGFRKGDKTHFEMITQDVPCEITKLIKKVDTQSGETEEKNPKVIGNGESGLIEIKTIKPVYIETQSEFHNLSAFRFTEKHKRIAFGICTKIN